MHWNNTKMDYGRNFQYTKLSVIELVPTDRRNLSGIRSKSALRSLIVTVCKWYGFFSVLAAVIPKNSDKWPWIEDGEGFAVHSRNRVARNASDVSAADWRYQTYLKKYDIISRVLHGFFQGSESLYNAVLYMIKCNNIKKAFNQYVI